MKMGIWIVGGMLAFGPLGPALAQTAADPARDGSTPQTGAPQTGVPPAGSPTQPDRSPETGVLQPPPGPPPQGEAADTKLPQCGPGKCGTPQIMQP
ncbi:hypothetical protein [Ancylobacter mangrovi]|uniref:hypothetical protein n=1 Tax=Ancylobacter mangrovi TaxID=2972472 RepID=UPI0021630FF6|nr:hypothetical protein [Ancylobacter mangrovi]MCS0502470.1 hypothetical protein [Ancylobacter mangrovi]